MLVILLVRSAPKKLRRYKRIGASETPSEMAHRATVRVSELKKGPIRVPYRRKTKRAAFATLFVLRCVWDSNP